MASFFVVCEVCGKTIPKKLARSHLNACLDAQERQAGQTPAGPSAPESGPDPGVRGSAGQEREGRAERGGERERAGEGGSASTAAGAPPSSAPSASPLDRRGKRGNTDAFSVLMGSTKKPKSAPTAAASGLLRPESAEGGGRPPDHAAQAAPGPYPASAPRTGPGPLPPPARLLAPTLGLGAGPSLLIREELYLPRGRPPSEITTVPLAEPRRIFGTPHPVLSGEYLFRDFLTEAEEDIILRCVEDHLPPWKPYSFLNGLYRIKNWGVEIDLRARQVRPSVNPLQPFLELAIQRMQGIDVTKDKGRPFRPTEANANEYLRDRGDVLQPHHDDRYLSTAVIANLSMAGEAIMTFIEDKTPSFSMAQAVPGTAREVNLVLPRRSLQVLTGAARYTWKHSIAQEGFLDPRRVSITFRESHVTVGPNAAAKPTGH